MMVVVKNFWSPCYWYNDIKVAALPIGFYTFMASLVIITYTCYVMAGGESSQFYMPYFETDIRDTTQIVGGLSIVFFLLFMIFSVIMVRGIRIEHRGLIIPWLACMSMIIFYQFIYGFWVLFDYYIYLETVFTILVNWLWMSYNIYCALTVYSNYQIIQEKQAPNLVLLYP